MMDRLLVAVDDSAPALAAAAFAIDLARARPAQLNVVSVGEVDRDADGILRHVASMAERAGCAATTTRVDGDRPFEALLRCATDWSADVIIMGRSDLRRPGQPYVGSQTEHLLEFTELPVVVVPA